MGNLVGRFYAPSISEEKPDDEMEGDNKMSDGHVDDNESHDEELDNKRSNENSSDDNTTDYEELDDDTSVDEEVEDKKSHEDALDDKKEDEDIAKERVPFVPFVPPRSAPIPIPPHVSGEFDIPETPTLVDYQTTIMNAYPISGSQKNLLEALKEMEIQPAYPARGSESPSDPDYPEPEGAQALVPEDDYLSYYTLPPRPPIIVPVTVNVPETEGDQPRDPNWFVKVEDWSTVSISSFKEKLEEKTSSAPKPDSPKDEESPGPSNRTQ